MRNVRLAGNFSSPAAADSISRTASRWKISRHAMSMNRIAGAILLREFGPDDLRAWAAELGVETYVGTSGRVFPRGQKAAGLLRAWLRRLRASGVEFRTGSRLAGLEREPDGWRAEFQTMERRISRSRLMRSFSRSAAPRGRKPDQTERGPRFWPLTEWTSLRGCRRIADGKSIGLPSCSPARKDCR